MASLIDWQCLPDIIFLSRVFDFSGSAAPELFAFSVKETLIKSGILEICAAFPSEVGDIQGEHAPLFSYSLTAVRAYESENQDDLR